MALSDSSAGALLAAATATPIAQLRPDLPDQKSRAVRGEVTVTWPFNSVTRSFAFLLAESDVLRRRNKGQVRIQLSGPSAQAAAACGLGGGDEVSLSLDGAEWAQDDSFTKFAGSRVEWQLKYSKRLLLKVTFGESRDTKVVDVDQPYPSETPVNVPDDTAELRPQEAESPPTAVPARRETGKIDLDEFASPAFIKRARVSYGSLFEGGLDIFDDDGGIKGKGRKRTRFGRDSSAWKYSSRSPSPEQDAQSEPNGVGKDNETASSPSVAKPPMLDEGVQTMELDANPDVRTAPSAASQPDQPALPPAIGHPMVGLGQPPSSLPAQGASASMELFKDNQPFGSALFGTYTPSVEPFASPLFPTASTTSQFGGAEIPLGDQVRFGFAEPQSTISGLGPVPVHSPAAQIPLDAQHLPTSPNLLATESHASPAAGDEALRETSSPTISRPGGQLQDHANGHPPHEQPLLWPINSETLDAQHAEGHLPVEAALQVTSGSAAVAGDVEPVDVPAPSDLPREADDYDYNSRRYQNEAEEHLVQMEEGPAHVHDFTSHNEYDDEEDPEAEYEEEEANEVGDDYDMRNYTDVDDDEEGFEAYENAESGAYGGEAQIFDGGDGSYDEDDMEDDEEDESEEDGDEMQPMPRLAPVPSQNAGPVVIDLISDSEDEPPPPRQPAAPPRPTLQEAANSSQFTTKSPTMNAEHGQKERHKVSPPAVRTQVVDFGSADVPADHEADPPTALRDEGSPSYEVDSEESGDESVAAEEAEESDEDAEGSTEEGMDGDEEAEEDEEDDDEEEAEEEIPQGSRGLMGDGVGSESLPNESSASGHGSITSPVMQHRPDQRTVDSTPSRGLHEDVNSNWTARKDVTVPSSPPLSLSFESQTFAVKPIMSSSSPTPSQGHPKQLPTPFGTQPSDLPALRQEAFYGTDGEEAAATSMQSPRPDVSSAPLDQKTSDEPERSSEVVEDTFASQQQAAETKVKGASDNDSPSADHPADPQDEQEPSVVQLPPPPSLVKEVALSEPVPDQIEMEGEAISVVQLPPPASLQMGDESGLSQKADTRATPASAVEGVAEQASSQASEQRSEKGDNLEDATAGRATRGRAKKDAAATKEPLRRKPAAAEVDPSIELARSSRRAKRGANQELPSPAAHTRSRSFQKSPSAERDLDPSIQLARAALASPSKAGASGSTLSSLKSELTKRLRSDLPECLPLHNLSHHVNKLVNVIAMATTDSTTPQRTKARQFALSFNVVDPGTAPSAVVEVQVYRAHKDSLPTVKAGDGVLLRNFQIAALTNRGFGLRSQDESSYAVFEQDDETEPQVKGPPVEDMEVEATYMVTLKKWYGMVDQGKVAAANQRLAAAGAAKK